MIVDKQGASTELPVAIKSSVAENSPIFQASERANGSGSRPVVCSQRQKSIGSGQRTAPGFF